MCVSGVESPFLFHFLLELYFIRSIPPFPFPSHPCGCYDLLYTKAKFAIPNPPSPFLFSAVLIVQNASLPRPHPPRHHGGPSRLKHPSQTPKWPRRPLLPLMHHRPRDHLPHPPPRPHRHNRFPRLGETIPRTATTAEDGKGSGAEKVGG